MLDLPEEGAERPSLRGLVTDRFLLIGAAVLLGIGLSYVLPGVDPILIENLSWYVWEALVLVVCLCAIQAGLRRSESEAGVLFWNYVAAGFCFWFVASCLVALIPGAREDVPVSLLGDCVYCTFYVVLALATAQRPDLSAQKMPRPAEEQLKVGAAVLFILALLLYFVVIPALFAPSDYLASRSSLLFYVCLDLFISVRLVYLTYCAELGKWRLVYALLLASFVLCLATDLLEFLSITGAIRLPQYVGTAWDLVWLLPFVPLLVAARVPRHATADWRVRDPRAIGVGDLPGGWEPFAFFAITFPFLHLVFDYLELAPDGARSYQVQLVLIYFLLFGAVALLHSMRRERERRDAERQLLQSQHSYRQLVESHPSAILIEQDGEVVYCNKAGFELFGVGTMLLGLSLRELGLPYAESDLRRSPSKGAKLQRSIECQVTHRDGRRVDLEVDFHRVRFMSGKAIQAVARDVTEAKRRRFEEERLQRLASLGEFSAAMAHEIRNPLASISMRAYYLREHTPLSEDIAEILDDVDVAVQRMKKQIAEILEYARPSALQLGREDLQEVVEASLLGLAEQAAEAGITISRRYNHTRSLVDVDTQQMVVALKGILGNAIRSMSRGGRLSIETKNLSDSLMLTIEDTGEGIAELDLPHVFEPFFSRRQDGVGLGLALVARILDQHGWEYRVTSSVGKGTRFVLVGRLCREAISSWPEVVPALGEP